MDTSSNTARAGHIERRSESRHKAYLAANLANKSQNVFATIVDLSKSGLGIRTSKPYDKGETLDVFVTEKRKNRVKIQINVQACHEKRGEYYLGTKIIGSSKSHSNLYNEILHSHRPKIIK